MMEQNQSLSKLVQELEYRLEDIEGVKENRYLMLR